MSLPRELLRKYNVQGPRYTSYPTVPYWESTPSQSNWISSIDRSLRESEKAGSGAALYIHIPFCETLCTFCGCNTRITRNRKVGAPYIETILKEWEIYRNLLGRPNDIPVTELHLGGGTPTFLTPDELQDLLNPLLATFSQRKDSEYSVEADPRVTTPDHLKTLFRLGFKRLSLGIQDFDPQIQMAVNRVHSEEKVREVVDGARELGFTSVNFDLIYGLPFQTLTSIRETLASVQRLKPDRIAFYAYAHVPWIKPGHRRFSDSDLPSGDAKRELYELGREMLEECGYMEIGMDHFALKTDPLYIASQNQTLHRNFMGYISRQVSPLIGLGVSAIGDSWTQFLQNEKLLEKYVEMVQGGSLPIHRGHMLNEEDQIIRRHILNLMTKFKTDWSKPESFTPWLKEVPEKLKEMQNDGLLELGPSQCTITPKGRAFIRNVCMAFDARLNRKAPDTELFSRTI